MKVEEFIRTVNASFYTGVPDSQLKALCDYLMDTFGVDNEHHIIAANEGNCVGIAAGYHLATGQVPVVYLQNSGEGNIINPVASIVNDEIYAIPMLFVIGWRGEPGVHDEPQHKFQGKITLKLLETLSIKYYVIEETTTVENISTIMKEFNALFKNGKQAAFVIKKGALWYDGICNYSNKNTLVREEIISHILKMSGSDPIISTTGKTSRELFELREKYGMSHGSDFLTVGGMGHNSSIALGISIKYKDKKIWCLDGDGAALMHMGSLATIGSASPENLIHVLINNESHESVGGLPTVSAGIDWSKIALGCGYKNIYSIEKYDELDKALVKVKTQKGPSFIEIKCGIGARANLGRPTVSTLENKRVFIDYIRASK